MYHEREAVGVRAEVRLRAFLEWSGRAPAKAQTRTHAHGRRHWRVPGSHAARCLPKLLPRPAARPTPS